MRAPAAPPDRAAGASHDNRELHTCTFQGPGLQNTTKIQRKDPRERRKNENCGGRGKKKSEILGGPGEGRSRGRAVQGKGGPGEGRSRGRAVQGKGGPGEGRSRGRAVQGKGGPGEGRSRGRAVQGKGSPNQTLKPTPTHEMKQYPRHSDNTPHNKSNSIWPKSVLAKVGLAKVGFGQSRFWPKSVWPKSVLAKVGHTTKTLTLAKVGLAKLGSKKGSPKSDWPKSVWPQSAMTAAYACVVFRACSFFGDGGILCAVESKATALLLWLAPNPEGDSSAHPDPSLFLFSGDGSPHHPAPKYCSKSFPLDSVSKVCCELNY